jgi:hypothetical protein
MTVRASTQSRGGDETVLGLNSKPAPFAEEQNTKSRHPEIQRLDAAAMDFTGALRRRC